MSTLLDTNVLSELLRAAPDPLVLTWFAAQPSATLFVSAVTQAEMVLGARLLPAGKRRVALEAAVGAMFSEDFAGHILPCDSAVVPAYVDIVTAAVPPAVPSRSSTPRSPPSQSMAAPGWRRATSAISRAAASR